MARGADVYARATVAGRGRSVTFRPVCATVECGARPGVATGEWTVARMVTCRELVELVTDYLDGTLPPARRAEVVAHLEECAGCLRYLAQLQTTRQVVAGTPSPALSPDDRAAALAAFRAWCATEHVAPAGVRRRWWRRLGPGHRAGD